MKAEERKELKTNTLVHTLERVKDGLKQGPSRRTVVVLGVLGLVVLLFVVWKIAANLSEKRNSKRWEELYTAKSPAELDSLVEQNKNTVQGRAARLQIARDDLRSALSGSFDGTGKSIYDDSGKATEKLKHAADEFEKLAKDFKATPILVQECLFGAAQASEAIGEFGRAEELYADVAKRWPDSPLGEQAGKSAERVHDKKSELEKIQGALKKSEP
jgi:hypothetical protein